MDINIEYLLYFLEDDLRDLADLRIHPVAPAGTVQSPDLPQDYDPNEKSVHLNRGVRVRAGSRDYFFPASWVEEGKMENIREQSKEIREFWSSRMSEN